MFYCIKSITLLTLKILVYRYLKRNKEAYYKTCLYEYHAVKNSKFTWYKLTLCYYMYIYYIRCTGERVQHYAKCNSYWKDIYFIALSDKDDITFSDVQVEEIAIQNCLYTASYNSNKVKETLKVVAIHPVENVQCSVWTQCKQVMTGNGLCFSCLADHEKLWQNSNRF